MEANLPCVPFIHRITCKEAVSENETASLLFIGLGITPNHLPIMFAMQLIKYT